MQRVAVVGGGVGGLFCAAKLAREGKDVTLIEKNKRANAGGRLECETVKAGNGRSYRFETGPSLLLLPDIYREALAELGLAADEFLDLARVRPSYGVHFSDGLPTPLLIGGDAEAEQSLARDMESVEPGSYARYQDYLASSRSNLAAPSCQCHNCQCHNLPPNFTFLPFRLPRGPCGASASPPA